MLTFLSEIDSCVVRVSLHAFRSNAADLDSNVTTSAHAVAVVEVPDRYRIQNTKDIDLSDWNK